jgi:hypothetical protein
MKRLTSAYRFPHTQQEERRREGKYHPEEGSELGRQFALHGCCVKATRDVGMMVEAGRFGQFRTKY